MAGSNKYELEDLNSLNAEGTLAIIIDKLLSFPRPRNIRWLLEFLDKEIEDAKIKNERSKNYAATHKEELRAYHAGWRRKKKSQ